MKVFKRILRLSGLIVLIILACLGIGIIGGTPVPPKSKKEDTIEVLLDAERPADASEGRLVLFERP